MSISEPGLKFDKFTVFVIGFLVFVYSYGLAFAELAVVKQPAKTANIYVSPTNLSPGDQLVIKMSLPHPGNLAIVGPDGTVYYLHDPGSKVFMQLTRDFSEIKTVKLNINELIAAYWADGEKKHGPVFRVPGKYRVFIADNLEDVEHGEINSLSAEINFVNKRVK